MAAWRGDLGAGILHWRMLRTRIPGRFMAGKGYEHPSRTAGEAVAWDDLEMVPRLAREAGLAPWLYVSVFDEGWPLARPSVRAVSYHTVMHAQHVSWQSELTRCHREWLVVDRSGRRRHRGVVSLAYPGARRAFVESRDRLHAELSRRIESSAAFRASEVDLRAGRGGRLLDSARDRPHQAVRGAAVDAEGRGDRARAGSTP
jgi:hypothetical protein